MVNMGKVGRIVKKITTNAKNEESYGTGLLGEKIIISSYKEMPIEKLEKLRYIMNKIIKKRKEMKRVNERKKE